LEEEIIVRMDRMNLGLVLDSQEMDKDPKKVISYQAVEVEVKSVFQRSTSRERGRNERKRFC
jgi:hypothetical protein